MSSAGCTVRQCAALLVAALLVALTLHSCAAQAVCNEYGTEAYSSPDFSTDNSLLALRGSALLITRAFIDSSAAGGVVATYSAVLGAIDSSGSASITLGLYYFTGGSTVTLIGQSVSYAYDGSVDGPYTISVPAMSVATLPAADEYYVAIIADNAFGIYSQYDSSYPDDYYFSFLSYQAGDPLPTTFSPAYLTPYYFSLAQAVNICPAPAAPPASSSSSSSSSLALPTPSSSSPSAGSLASSSAGVAASSSGSSAASSSAALGLTSSSSSSSSHQAKNLILNPGFETGSFSSWTLSGACEGEAVLGPRSQAHSGQYSAHLGTSALCSLSQAVVLRQGRSYSLSFWLDSDSRRPNFVNITAVIEGEPAVVVLKERGITRHPYELYTAQLTAPPTGRKQLTLTYISRDSGKAFLLDDVALRILPASQ